jgi:hypothetical protein
MFAMACGDDKVTKSDGIKKDTGPKKYDGPKTPDGPIVVVPDGPKTDKPIGPTPDGQGSGKCDSAIIGKPCTEKGNECGNDHTCLTTSATGGFCTCKCTIDDSSTPLVNEDTCPDLSKNECGRVRLVGGTTENFCLKLCTPKYGANDCAGNIACDPRSGASFGIFDKAVCAFPGCTKNEDCPVVTATKCTGCGADGKGCDPPVQKDCPAGQLCSSYIGGDEGRCFLAGVCDTKSGLCNDHKESKNPTAKVGDPCTDDTKCAGNMRCMQEFDRSKYQKKEGTACAEDDDCCSGTCTNKLCTKGNCTVDYRNGYCMISGCAFAASLTNKACPAGSDCNNLYTGGMCQKTCDMTKEADCRGNANDLWGDYDCRAWDRLSLGGVPAAKAHTCDFGTGITCDIFKSAKLDCAALGDASDTKNPNPTKMRCQYLDKTDPTDKYDPQGYCLDNTGSGTKTRANKFP